MPAPLFALVPAAYLLMLRQTPPRRPGGGRTEVLLQLRRNTGYMDGCWACAVAGHVEVGEPVTRTVVREAAEEAGIVGLEVVKRLLGATVLEEITVTQEGR